MREDNTVVVMDNMDGEVTYMTVTSALWSDGCMWEERMSIV